MNQTSIETTDKPTGPAAAVMIAAGIGSFVLGIGVVLNEYSGAIRDFLAGFGITLDFNAFLQFDRNFGLGSGVGPLSGKVALAVIAFVASWVILHLAWRARDVDLQRAFVATLILVGLGFALTFPPIFAFFV